MPEILPLISSVPHYEFVTDLGGASYLFELRWNHRDAAWYMSVSELDGQPIMRGVKIVIGGFLGRQYQHRLVSSGALIATDLSGANLDAGLDDLGSRVVVARWTSAEIVAAVRHRRLVQRSA